MVDILDDGGYMKVVQDVVYREIVVIEVLSSVEQWQDIVLIGETRFHPCVRRVDTCALDAYSGS